MNRLTCLTALALILPPVADSRADDLKDTINGSVRALRAIQHEDGSYGSPAHQPLATARVLQAFGDCHEHYTSQDGPFVREAVEFLLSRQQQSGGFGPGGPKTILWTAEALLALDATAKTEAFAAARQRASRFLSGLSPAQLENRAVAARVQVALSGGGPLRHVASLARAEERGGDEKQLLERMVPRLVEEQGQALAALDDSAVPAAANRLLAMIELYALRNSMQKDTTTLPAMTRRPPPESPAAERQRIQRALAYLESIQVAGRFGFGEHSDPGITGIALSAAIKSSERLGIERPAYVQEGLTWLASLQKEDGGIYQLGLKNYVTSVAIEALKASGDQRFDAAIQKAVVFLTMTQLDEDEGYSSEQDPYYGGFGYGSSEKPDLSNTQMALQALHEAEVPTGESAYSKAVQFLEKCQNRPESGIDSVVKRDGTVIVAGTDGGAVYRPGDSKAGSDEVGDGKRVMRSYGSMTYALLKSYLFAGLDPADPRIQEAVTWISENYTLEVNPGFQKNLRGAEYQGLFYYYLTLARALNAYGAEQLEDGAGRTHDWKQELREMLFSLQDEDGSWTNVRSTRWMEGNPVLTTSYALLALTETF